MATNAILLQHDLSLGGVGVSGDVTSFSIEITADEVEVPATAGSRYKGHKAGALDCSITINFLQGETATNISEIFYAAILTDSGQVTFSGKMTDNSTKRYAGTFVVTNFQAGGDVYTIGMQSVTFKVIGAITRTVVAS